MSSLPHVRREATSGMYSPSNSSSNSIDRSRTTCPCGQVLAVNTFGSEPCSETWTMLK